MLFEKKKSTFDQEKKTYPGNATDIPRYQLTKILTIANVKVIK